MAEIHAIQRDLKKIRLRARLHWITLCGGLVSALLLIPVSIAAAKVAGLVWVILSIATWMSPMMSVCPSCHKSFFKGPFPSVWALSKCANCGMGLDGGA